MTTTPGSVPRVYRCPCCGYRDDVAMEEAEVRVACKHCSTPLHLSLRQVDELRLDVTVTEEVFLPEISRGPRARRD